jgi:hypothetical protein
MFTVRRHRVLRRTACAFRQSLKALPGLCLLLIGRVVFELAILHTSNISVTALCKSCSGLSLFKLSLHLTPLPHRMPGVLARLISKPRKALTTTAGRPFSRSHDHFPALNAAEPTT